MFMKNIIVVVVIISFLSIVTVTGCKKGRQSTGGKTGIQTFVTYKYTDPMTGMEAFRLLIPKGWQTEGKITWSSNPALPAQARFRFFNPNGTEEMNLFPTQSYFWTNNQIFLRTNPPGSLRFGTLVMRPIDLHTAFTKVIIPQAKARVNGLSVIEEKRVEELATLARGAPTPGVHSSAEAGKIRIQYTENGRQMEEEMYAAVSQFITELPGSYFTRSYFINYWYIDYVFSLKSEKNKLDSNSKIFQTMVYSMRVNPRWFAKVANAKEIMAQNIIRGIKAVGRIGEMVARAGSEIREDQMRSWEQRQQAQDKIAQNFSDYIRGVDRFYDPLAGKEVELPSGYGRAWANNLGEYIVTDSPSYNPNIGSNLHWEELNPAK
ncbi:MAG: hypothetical protein A2Z47_05965 [Thermodesulfovibrio sp. RBG_19FT_COMBO_42_12]|nr:MAG: hypothetical protein A2Z47_05965 [Thermodesulfovibrio sp. RBG_19FT_COMBO_42_12]